jgi:6-phosphogluconolactonase
MASIEPIRQKIYILGSAQAPYEAIASHIAELINKASATKDYFNLVLSGGETPRELYKLLTTDYQKKIPWLKVRLYWGDERFVPHDDPESNYRMAKETLLLEQPIPSENVFPMPVDQPTADAAALFYERLLKSQFNEPWPHFDLILLGLGADCHVASLFPNSSAIHEQKRWVVATEHPLTSQPRLSLTLPVLNQARNIHFLVRGKDKAEALKRATTDPPDPGNCPASAVRPVNGELSWWADWEAAHLIS